MADIKGRPNILEDYLITLHNESWFYFTDVNNKTYKNLRLSEKIWDVVNKTIIDNSHSLPSETECNTGLENLQSQWDAEEWKRNRQAEYPDLQEAIHALLDGGDTLTELQAKRTATKTKYPKSGA